MRLAVIIYYKISYVGESVMKFWFAAHEITINQFPRFFLITSVDIFEIVPVSIAPPTFNITLFCCYYCGVINAFCDPIFCSEVAFEFTIVFTIYSTVNCLLITLLSI